MRMWTMFMHNHASYDADTKSDTSCKCAVHTHLHQTQQAGFELNDASHHVLPAALQVSGVNYQAYAFDGNGSPSSEQDVMDDFSSGDSSVFNEFGVAKGQEIIFGVAPNRPGPESTPPVDSDCAGIERIKDLVCPALRDCTKGDLCADYTKSWAGGIMVFDFDTEFKLGKFTLVNTAYQALSGHCDDIQKC